MELDWSRADLGLGLAVVPIWFALWAAIVLMVYLLEWLPGAIRAWLVKRRRAHMERRLEAQSNHLKKQILELAEIISASRDEASESMLRAHFMTTGRLPDAK
ncbi:hypothetical protein [Agrococcus baldri]|uniref:Uncharacterized protein n=1 Tax=Agrococcus baldri TaxID=153730 RepID=A0AA87RIT1_9MICO|nr:hypothetical protein [Agrococcus baldri]GEK80133.1 hypothetical protein ABA31_14840 [Agrococcus baldri]